MITESGRLKQSESNRIRMTAKAGSQHTGMRLDQLAAVLFPDFSRARLQKWVRRGELTVDGQALKTTYRISGGETLRLDALPERHDEVLPQDIPLEVIHADDDIIVINKPAGLVVHPAAGHPDGTLQNALLHFDSGLAVLPRSGIVHRLDKDTTGVMVVARSLRAHSSLVEQLQARQMSRVYEAVARGETDSSGTVNAPIGRHPRDRKRMAVVMAGKPAITRFRVMRRFRGFSHLEVSLESGRTHQIRVHMLHIGHPLVGDPVYGKSLKALKGVPDALLETIRAFPRQALHARRLGLVHPASGATVCFEAPLPADMEGLLAALSKVAI
ncbi:MAG: 23S rRNA pseudouridine(1911/1915/1917) synthase RluD [Xanthomonadales bacterium]